MPAAGTRRPAAGLRAADPAQRKKSGKPDFFEVVELVEGPERHDPCLPGALGGVLSHTLTWLACLRRTPSQARERRRILAEEDRVETAVDGSQINATAGNDAGGHALAAIEPLEGGGAVLAELARAVEHDLATPDHAPATERAYAHDWADFAAFCGRHGLAPLPAAPPDPRTLPQGLGDPEEPLAGRSCGWDRRALIADHTPATRRNREPPRDGRT